jgi:hypothetical protein
MQEILKESLFLCLRFVVRRPFLTVSLARDFDRFRRCRLTVFSDRRSGLFDSMLDGVNVFTLRLTNLKVWTGATLARGINRISAVSRLRRN